MPFAPAVDEDLLDQPVLDGMAAGRGDRGGTGARHDARRVAPVPGPDRRRARRRATRPSCRAAGSRRRRARHRRGVSRRARTDGRQRRRLGGRSDRRAMRIPTLRLAEARATSGTPAFVYRFDWAAPGLGAVHAVDVPFTFGTFDREGWGDAVGHEPAADVLGVRLRASWAALGRDRRPVTGRARLAALRAAPTGGDGLRPCRPRGRRPRRRRSPLLPLRTAVASRRSPAG